MPPLLPLRIECWGQADAALAELARLAKRLAAVDEQRAAALARMESEVAAARQPLQERRAKLEATVEKFCRRHRAELDRVDGHARRSRWLLFGRVGYRLAPAVLIRDEAAALRALAHWRAGQQFLRTRTELDREALRQFLLNEANGAGRAARQRVRLRRAGIAVDRRDNWFYELDWKAVEKWG